ncbi:Methyltransferase type 11 [Kribbella flavida DSM 17836]|uniref:Methyltransferase type 11 n=1 Tax=Kribbella flavida (strain DSM 17836 / JCM 10339 / NBRC 14399) TaxID=479435 RepID=D2PX06_KRIFD|nr:class I SAM-dependent methyltransferase [Kribbella flavida]ADB35386.1 Methyltransferase type 11 [Kribbella flavida DSM 17836]
MRARYNGAADWYAARSRTWAEDNRDEVLGLLGPGAGRRCLDLGCGNGGYFGIVEETGRELIGLDRSSDQLRLARQRPQPVPLVEGDSVHLPFAEASFDDVLALWISTDLDDFGGTVREIARVLKPGGFFYFYGVHPCFNGPHVEYQEDGGRLAHPTYRVAGWHEPQRWWAGDGIRATVGMRHVPLAELLNAFLAAGLQLDHVVEPDAGPVPAALAIRARR